MQWLHAEGKVLVSHAQANVGVVTLYRQDMTVCSPDPTEVGKAHMMLSTRRLVVLGVQPIEEQEELWNVRPSLKMQAPAHPLQRRSLASLSSLQEETEWTACPTRGPWPRVKLPVPVSPPQPS